MIPHVIKYVSIDGLVKYEAWDNPTRRPEETLNRIGVLSLHPVSYKGNIDFPESMQVHRRTYKLFQYYTDEINGNRIFEYREYL